MTAAGRWVRSLRAFSFPASLVPVSLAAVLAVGNEAAWWTLGWYALAALLFHAGTNVLNDYYDFRHGVDSSGDPDPTHAITQGIVTPRYMLVTGHIYFGAGIAAGAVIALVRGPIFFLVGLAGAIGAYFYTNARFSLKYRALGDIAVFLLMGPALVFIGTWAIEGRPLASSALAALPIGFFVTAILHGNNMRDIVADRGAGIDTVASRLGFQRSRGFFVVLLALSFLSLVALVAAGTLPIGALAGAVALPGALALARRVLGAGSGGELIDLPVRAAGLHMLFGVAMCVGILAETLIVA